MTGITKGDRIYYKVLLVSQKVIRGYYKVWQVLQCMSVVTKLDVTQISIKNRYLFILPSIPCIFKSLQVSVMWYAWIQACHILDVRATPALKA